MKAEAMNAFGGVRFAQDKSRNDGSQSNCEPGALQEFVPSATSVKIPSLQSSMIDTASTATGARSGRSMTVGGEIAPGLIPT
jgi:hypothetical protein